MKKLYTLAALLLLSMIGKAQIITFTDPTFKAKLLASSPSSNTAQNLAGVNFKIDANNNGEIEVSEAQQVSYLYMIGSPVPITSFDGLSYFINLKTFASTMNNAAVLNLSGMLNLEYLDCQATHVINLDISNCPVLDYVNASLNEMTGFNMAGSNSVTFLNLAGCDLTNLDVSNFTNLEELNCKQSDFLQSLNVLGCTALKKLTCFQTLIPTFDFTGLTALETLDIYQNQLTSINFTGCTALTNLNCNLNLLTTLNLDGLSNLSIASAGGNSLTSLSYNGCVNLKELYIDSNSFTTFDATGLPALEKLIMGTNQLSSLNIAGMAQLKTLDLYDNDLTALDFSGCTGLLSAQLGINNFSFLDFTECTSMYGAGCGYNPSLTTILAKNGGSLVPTFPNSPSLIYICANENNAAQLQSAISAAGLVNCHVNGYCSFTPGGTYYSIEGSTKFDFADNGCDVSDAAYPNLKLTFNNGTTSAAYIADASGDYHYDVQAGTYTVTSAVENSGFFTVSPASVSVSFPSTTSPFIQNFCVTPNGSHPDLEITIVPLNVARPGFDVDYLLTYRNKGNVLLSGTVNFEFNDAISDVVSTEPAFTTQSANQLSWDFINLGFFESRSINVKLNLNSPQEIPAVNSLDILTYEVNVTPVVGDETPQDNSTYLNQSVFNSLDPNDKTCLEGNTISPEMVNKYVHYLIRFENTGTFAAQNIVVKDIIDTAKFDIASLTPTGGSAAFETRISNTNRVEFIFENINLPFDDANNDGYVAFKIKTKPTLVLGNTFSNTANIYFDYNYPITTNTAITTVSNILANIQFAFDDYFSIYPNPVTEKLQLQTQTPTKISSVSIYNILGQLVQTQLGDSHLIDVSKLTSGSYIVKVYTDRGSAAKPFIKN